MKHHLKLFALSFHGARKISINHETIIKLIGIVTMIFGFTLHPFVSSSKNLMRPPLDAGSGAALLFLLLITNQKSRF
ncbi:hypothetical protein JI55_01595 [Nitrosopumilus sp. PRT-SC01]|nr:hypothetical protein JI55_01595 [Nitrosopumilus sp. PRT-SC01]